MKTLTLSCCAVILASCATGPREQGGIPVEIVQGKLVHVWGTTAVRLPEGARISGFAARKLSTNGVVNEHLHAEAIAEDGRVLDSRDVAWNTPASVRTRTSTSFQTVFDTLPAGEPSRIRLKVVEGPTHVGK